MTPRQMSIEIRRTQAIEELREMQRKIAAGEPPPDLVLQPDLEPKPAKPTFAGEHPRCGICGAPSRKFTNLFQCSEQPAHVADLNRKEFFSA